MISFAAKISWLGVLAAAVRMVVARFRVVTVAGDSMTPAFADGGRVLVLRVSPRRLTVGDVVVVRLPGIEATLGPRDRPWLVKRVAALPGDPVPVPVATAVGRDRYVPSGKLVVLGDNSTASLDSRDLGYVGTDLLLGRVVKRLT